MVSQLPVTDIGFLLLKEDQSLASRIAMLHYEYYDSLDGVVSSIKEMNEFIQCVVSNITLPVRSLHPGEAQKPALWDYADQVDTMEFLLSLI